MLPWLDKKRMSQTIKAKRHPSGTIETRVETNGLEPEKSAIMSEIMDAVKNEDTQGLWDALQAAFQSMDAEPHMEGPHEGEV